MAISEHVVKCLQETHLLFTGAASYRPEQKGSVIQKALDTNPTFHRLTAATAGTQRRTGRKPPLTYIGRTRKKKDWITGTLQNNCFAAAVTTACERDDPPQSSYQGRTAPWFPPLGLGVGGHSSVVKHFLCTQKSEVWFQEGHGSPLHKTEGCSWSVS